MKRQLILVIVGLGLLAFALFGVNNWYWFEPLSVNRLVLIVAGVLLLAIGIMGEHFPARQLGTLYQNTATLLLNTLLFIMLMSFLVDFAINLRVVSSGSLIGDNRRGYRIIKSENGERGTGRKPSKWGQFTCHMSSGEKPFSGDLINVDAKGIRQTPQRQCEEDTLIVWTFGGSTMWGVGAPDWGTIAAYLQKGLVELLEEPVCLTNYGEIGFVSTQEVIQLMVLLQEGKRPDLVIFYDGLNDIYAAYETGTVGVHLNLGWIKAGLEENSVFDALLRDIQQTNMFDMVNAIGGEAQQVRIEVDAPSLASSIKETVLFNYNIVDLLAERYDFEVMFFWQPAISVHPKPFTSVEQQIHDELDPTLTELYAETYRQIRAEERNDFFYIADVFENVNEFLWIDFVHITAEGNQIIANRMLETLTQEE